MDLSPDHDRNETRLGRGALAGITALMLVGLLMGSSVGGRAVQSGNTRGVDATVVREIAATFQRAARRIASPDTHQPVAVAVRRSQAVGSVSIAVLACVMRVEANVQGLVQVAHLDLPPPVVF